MIEIDMDLPYFSLKGTGKVFGSINEMLEFYESNPLSFEIRKIGRPCHYDRKCSIL